MQKLLRRRDVPFPLFDVDVLSSDDEGLLATSKDLGLALSLEEMKNIRDYFARKGRNPTDVELQSLGQAWSEHCCYKSSKVFLKEFIFPVQAPYVIDRGDAGVVEFDDEHAYALRIESHNHPSAVEPYGGAATGIGGIVRDVLCMGARPIALIDPLHFGPLDYPYEKLPKGLKHPKYLFNGVVAGIRDYGNRIGVPTVSGCVVFDEGYVGNIVVNVGCVGFARKESLVRNRARSDEDLFVLVGGRTGRDGIHGVTYASVDLTEEAVEEWHGGAVQLGDPIMKEPLMHACLEAAEMGLLSGMKDLGGGGLSCVIGEMALAGGYGAEVELDKVPLKESGLSPWEIWVSESQERMMLAVHPSNVKRVMEIFDLYDVPATVIGRVIEEKICRVIFGGVTVVDMDLDFYTGGPEYCRVYSVPEAPHERVDREPPEPRDLGAVIISLLSSPNIASKELVIRQYDHEVRASTVLKPMQGVVGKATHGDACVIRPLADSYKALAIATASTPYYTALDAFRGGASAVDEVCRNLVSVGSRPHSFTNCLNFGNPEKPDRLGSFREAVRGIGSVARALNLPIPSGNVSLYNESALGSVPPTPVVLGVGLVADFRKCITSDLKFKGNHVFLVGETKEEMAGSEYYRLVGTKGGSVPGVDTEKLKAGIDGLIAAIDAGHVAACHDLSHGGLAIAAAEMCLGGDIGMRIDVDMLFGHPPHVELFSESNSRWLVEVKSDRKESFPLHFSGIPVRRIGETGGKSLRILRGPKEIALDLRALRNAWSRPLHRLAGG